MADFNAISEALPAPRDDEPPDLRRDILDELADHLDCALRRERLTGGTADAERRVVEKFGDPAAIARTLWKDALWEKIVSQRLMLGLCAAMMLICCAALGLTATWLNRQETLFRTWQQASDARLKSQTELFSKMAAASEASSKTMSEQMQLALQQSQEAAAKAEPFSEWNSVELRFVRGKKDGEGVPDVLVRLRPALGSSGKSESNADVPEMTKTSDAAGVVRFDRVRYGSYSLSCTLAPAFSCERQLTAMPGEKYEETIVCPPPLSAPFPVKFQIDWPEEIQNEQPLLYLDGAFNATDIWRENHAPWAVATWRFSSQLVPGTWTGAFLSKDKGIELGRCVNDRPSVWLGSRGNATNRLDRTFSEGASSVRLDGRQEASLSWPGLEYRPTAATLVFGATAEPIGKILQGQTSSRSGFSRDPRMFGGGSSGSTEFDPAMVRLSMPISMHDWGQKLDPGDPQTLVLTPSQRTLDDVRERINRYRPELAAIVEQVEASRKAYEEREATLAKEQAARVTPQKKPEPFSEWNPVELKFVEGSPDGPPVTDLSVTFSPADKSNDFPSVTKPLSADGTLLLERVRYGSYHLTCMSLDRGNLRFQFTLLPGEAFKKTIVCPKKLTPGTVRLTVDWPEDLKQRRLFIMPSNGFVMSRPASENPGYFWDIQAPEGAAFSNPAKGAMPLWKTLLIGPSGESDSMSQSGSPLGLKSSVLSSAQRQAATRLTFSKWQESAFVPEQGMVWPSPEWRLRMMSIALEIPADSGMAQMLTGFNADDRIFSVSPLIFCASWESKREAGDSTSVILSPPKEAVDTVREFVKAYDELMKPAEPASKQP